MISFQINCIPGRNSRSLERGQHNFPGLILGFPVSPHETLSMDCMNKFSFIFWQVGCVLVLDILIAVLRISHGEVSKSV